MNIRFPACIGGMLLLLSSGLAAQTLVYEREYTLIGEDNLLRIEITPDDRMLAVRPGFMTKPGRHTWQLPAGSYGRLSALLDNAFTDSSRLHADVQRQAASQLQVVTDPEFSRFALVDPQRGPLQTTTVVSLEAWAQRLDDPRLERLDTIERELFRLMNRKIEEGER